MAFLRGCVALSPHPGVYISMKAETLRPVRVEDEVETLKHTSLCYYCQKVMIEVPGNVYHVLGRWMCEDCHFEGGNTKFHCKPRPYSRPMVREKR